MILSSLIFGVFSGFAGSVKITGILIGTLFFVGLFVYRSFLYGIKKTEFIVVFSDIRDLVILCYLHFESCFLAIFPKNEYIENRKRIGIYHHNTSRTYTEIQKLSQNLHPPKILKSLWRHTATNILKWLTYRMFLYFQLYSSNGSLL